MSRVCLPLCQRSWSELRPGHLGSPGVHWIEGPRGATTSCLSRDLLALGKDNKALCLDPELDAPLLEISISGEIYVIRLRAGLLPLAPPHPQIRRPPSPPSAPGGCRGRAASAELPATRFLAGWRLPEIRGGSVKPSISPLLPPFGAVLRWLGLEVRWCHMLLTQESRPLRPHAGRTQDRGTGTSPPGPNREQNVLFTSYGERRVRGYRRVWTPGPWHIDELGRSETGRLGSRQAAVHARLHASRRRPPEIARPSEALDSRCTGGLALGCQPGSLLGHPGWGGRGNTAALRERSPNASQSLNQLCG